MDNCRSEITGGRQTTIFSCVKFGDHIEKKTMVTEDGRASPFSKEHRTNGGSSKSERPPEGGYVMADIDWVLYNYMSRKGIIIEEKGRAWTKPEYGDYTLASTRAIEWLRANRPLILLISPDVQTYAELGGDACVEYIIYPPGISFDKGRVDPKKFIRCTILEFVLMVDNMLV